MFAQKLFSSHYRAMALTLDVRHIFFTDYQIIGINGKNRNLAKLQLNPNKLT